MGLRIPWPPRIEVDLTLPEVRAWIAALDREGVDSTNAHIVTGTVWRRAGRAAELPEITAHQRRQVCTHLGGQARKDALR